MENLVILEIVDPYLLHRKHMFQRTYEKLATLPAIENTCTPSTLLLQEVVSIFCWLVCIW